MIVICGGESRVFRNQIQAGLLKIDAGYGLSWPVHSKPVVGQAAQLPLKSNSACSAWPSGAIFPFPMMTTVLILGPFILVWAIAALFYALGRRRARQLQLDEITFAQSVQKRLAPLLMSRPRTWLAIKSRNPEDVARSIGLKDPQPCASGNALSKLEQDHLFVSPPVNGWVIVLV